jgi:hypothetical protein
LLLFAATLPVSAQVVLTEGTNLNVDVSSDGRIATDLLGGIWIVPLDGGEAVPLDKGLLPAKRPRWSPDQNSIAYQARSGNQEQLWLYDFATRQSSNISDGYFFDQHPSWHPDGERLVYSSDRNDSGFDLWELDLPTGLTWRLSDLPGDETEPVWSADGRDLLYVHQQDDRWSLRLRRHGKAEEILVSSDTRLSAPSWRPDGSLVTFLRESASGLLMEMAILSEPLLVRTLLAEPDFFDAPIAWHGRQQMLYTANGVIRRRAFNSWAPRTVPFRALIEGKNTKARRAGVRREIPLTDPATVKIVVRADRLFDGTGGDYREGLDIVIEQGRISAVEKSRDRGNDIVIDLGDLTVLPGLIDSYAYLPDDADESLGPVLLSLGITTIVADSTRAEALNTRWSGKQMPGPRVLRARDIASLEADDEMPWLITVAGDLDAGVARRSVIGEWQMRGVPVLAESWQVGLGSGASMMLGGESLPASPGGIRYQDSMLATAAGPVTLVSGLADALTPGLRSLLKVRQAEYLGNTATALRRFSDSPHLPAGTTSVIAGSKPNGLPPGLALHAELLALQAAGLDPEHVLRAASSNAAAALSANLQLGRIAPGAYADLVLVDGDPLNSVSDARNVVAVVRNGRFYSVAGLLETAAGQK